MIEPSGILLYVAVLVVGVTIGSLLRRLGRVTAASSVPLAAVWLLGLMRPATLLHWPTLTGPSFGGLPVGPEIFATVGWLLFLAGVLAGIPLRSSADPRTPDLEGRHPTKRLSYRTAPPDLPKVRALFYSLFGAIYVALDGGLAVFVIRWDHPTSVALFVVLSALFLGAAYGLTRHVTALVTRGQTLPALATLSRKPRVAMLYTTMNDVVPECLLAVVQDHPVDVFVLDDSSDPEARRVVDEISKARGYTVVRRSERRGFKAGAINDWFRQSGSAYDYLVLLDADSYLPSDWVREALRYAEHPANGKVAVFQGLINIWNFDTEFVATLAPMSRVGQYVWEERLGNALDAVFCYGHNALLRVSALKEIGGFVEGYVSEDFATAIAMGDRGWHCRFVPLHTYEAMPENVRGFIRRQNKWTRGAMEFIHLSSQSKLPASRKFHLWQTPYGHFTNLLLPVGMFLTIYGYTSTPSAAMALLDSFLRNPLGTFWSIALFRYLLVLGILATIPTVLVYRRCRITFRTYWRQRWLSSAVSAVALPYEFLSMVAYLAHRIRTIPVTPKGEKRLGPRDVAYIARYSLVLDGLVLSGLYFVNPVGAIFNSTWLLPMLLAPWLILRFSGELREAAPAPASASHPREVTARKRSERAVFASLARYRPSV